MAAKQSRSTTPRRSVAKQPVGRPSSEGAKARAKPPARTAGKPRRKKAAGSIGDSPKRSDAEVAAFHALNTLAIENAGKVLEMQIEAMHRYSRALIREWYDAVAVDDPAALEAYLSQQPKVVLSLSADAAFDVSRVARLGLDYLEHASAILDRSVTPGR